MKFKKKVSQRLMPLIAVVYGGFGQVLCLRDGAWLIDVDAKTGIAYTYFGGYLADYAGTYPETLGESELPDE